MPGGEAVAIAVRSVEPAPSDRQAGAEWREERDVEAGVGGVKKGESEKLCRICHLGSCVGGSEASELIQLGCACKGELGSAHRPCAEAWFRVKGNRSCEICGVNAKNINGEEDISFMERWHERRTLRRGGDATSETSRWWGNRRFCNFLIVCLVIAFVLPWFFHVRVL
ncbi:unnamed protein product [Musa acuminata var. zebrina]